MNVFALLMATCAWGILFLQALHMTNYETAAIWFFFAGVAQWVAGVVFKPAYKEMKGYFSD